MRTINPSTTVRQRILTICMYYNVSPNKLSEDAGLNRNYISKLRDTVSSALVHYIYCTFEEVSIEWLMTGNGHMLSSLNESSELLSLVRDLHSVICPNKNKSGSPGLDERPDEPLTPKDE